jgi:hypothetical protein
MKLSIFFPHFQPRKSSLTKARAAEPPQATASSEKRATFRLSKEFSNYVHCRVRTGLATRIIDNLAKALKEAQFKDSALPAGAHDPLARAAFEMAEKFQALAHQAAVEYPFRGTIFSKDDLANRLAEMKIGADWNLSSIKPSRQGFSSRDEELRHAIADRLWKTHQGSWDDQGIMEAEDWLSAAVDLKALITHIGRHSIADQRAKPPKDLLKTCDLPPAVPKGLVEELRRESSDFVS